MNDGIGIWLAARRLRDDRFCWPSGAAGTVEMTGEELDALVLGLPWHRIGEAGVIRVL